MTLLPRGGYLRLLKETLRTFPAAVILGPRQCGKSTLAAQLAKGATARMSRRFDLERPSDLERLSAAPEQDLGFLQSRPGLICIDEIQRAPWLFPLLRSLLDDPQRKARYVLLGSVSPSLVQGVSETLAGRIGFVDLTPLSMAEAAGRVAGGTHRLWARGGFPRSLLARSERASLDWRESYVRTFLEQDIPNLGIRWPAATLRRFWTMLAHLHGGLWNASELAAGLGVSAPTVSRYLDVLEGTFMVRRLTPYWANVGKRLTKSPKVYLRDSGILHALLGVPSLDGLFSHPKVGASWEGFVIEQVLAALALAGETVRASFWRTHGGAEVDLILEMRGRLIPLEIKLGAEPRVTRGLVECMKDLECPAGFVLHGGEESFPIGNRTWALTSRLLADPVGLSSSLLEPAKRAR